MLDKMGLAQAAQAKVEDWARGAQTLALFHTALRSGLLARLEVPHTPADLGGDEALVTEVCKTLTLAGVLAETEGRYQVTPGFAAALDPAMMMPLRGVLEGLQARVEALQESQGYDAAATAIAEGATLNPLSPVTEAVIGEWMQKYGSAIEWGERHCEFGCGVGGGLLFTLRLAPAMKGVGVERNPEVLERAQHAAELLGLSDRVEFRLGDVSEMADEHVFDTGFWSQSFFPEEDRGPALAAIRRALKPGGWLIVPGFEGGEPTDSLGYHLNRLVFRTWGVPARSHAGLQAELEEHGFQVVGGGPLGPDMTCLVARAR